VAPPAQALDGSALQALVARSALGDRAAFQELYQATAPKLFAVALRILRREDWAEEVLQECYVSVWRHAGEYDASRAAPMTWMTSIVRNRCLDWLRKPNPEAPDEDLLNELQSDNPGPLARLEQARDTAALGRCLRGLDARQRQAIALAFYEGLSHAELAHHLRQPLGTVKTWVRRGLARLRACLELQR
jgi:RNA polymerase sigma-70 factor, ECF subfamily